MGYTYCRIETRCAHDQVELVFAFLCYDAAPRYTPDFLEGNAGIVFLKCVIGTRTMSPSFCTRGMQLDLLGTVYSPLLCTQNSFPCRLSSYFRTGLVRSKPDVRHSLQAFRLLSVLIVQCDLTSFVLKVTLFFKPF